MNEQQHLETLSDIRRMMERSSRFISLSGLSGISAGITALAGGYIAYTWLTAYYTRWEATGAFNLADFKLLKIKLVILAGVVLGVALCVGTFFTWRRARRNQLPIWDATS